jgi:hypothetical protein
MKPAFDQDALIDMFSNASAQQGEQLRQAVSQATLGALQGRELSLKNIRDVLKTVTKAASAGIAQNATPGIDVESLLDKAVTGMDDALLRRWKPTASRCSSSRRRAWGCRRSS